ncbi:MAG: T9SS type A sorting domain-containing protein [Saprospiraceae bacterium]|nr:T9SS type A sorting domain-containing protein [Saprospiraceae bacterium]
MDNGAPVISGVPADSTIYLANGETVPSPATVTATDGCPAQSIPVVFSETSAPMGNDSCMTKIIRTWSATDSDGNTVVQQQEIIVVGFMDASIASTTPDTCGMGIGSATLLPDSYGYAWSDGGNGNIRTDLSAGTYTVTATNNGPTGAGCTEVLTVTIANVQVPLAIESISTTPETCGGGDGTATIAPANYDYAWSDPTGASAGTGAVRNDLAAGSYTVTATNGACSLVFVVDIADGCDCVAAVLDSLNTTDASCGAADGTATLNLAGDVADYGFLWIPNLGTSNAAGNARTGLPASHYVVLATYQGNNNCVEKFEFDIFDDCPKCAPIFSTASYTVSVSASPGLVCLPVPFAALSQQVVELDGAPNAGNLTPCDGEDVLNYGFEPFPNGLLQVRWRLASDTFYTLVNDLSAVAGFMNQLDAVGNWSFDAVNRRFVSGNIGGSYGKMQITHLPTGEVQESKAKMVKVPMGTSLYLTTGTHQLVVSNASTGCSDTLNITVNLGAIVQVEPSKLQPDTLQTKQGTPVIGDVLANDVIKQHIKQLTIAEQPANGTAWVNVDNTVSYRPLIEYCNSYEHQPLDQFIYEVCFENGSRMQSSVSVEVACEDKEPATEITLYPNPTNRFVYLDLSPIAGKPVVVEVFNNLGVKMQTISLEEAPSVPLKIELDGYAAGHYAVLINSPGSKPFVRQLIVGGR